MKKELCIVSHTHWDREWYLSHAKHNYRLVKFFDALIDAMEKDEKFRYFHLDGQIVVIEDYLAVRPEMEANGLRDVDAVIIDNEPAKAFVANNTGLKILDTSYADEDYAACIKKGNDALREAIDEAIEELVADGTIDTIVSKYIK